MYIRAVTSLHSNALDALQTGKCFAKPFRFWQKQMAKVDLVLFGSSEVLTQT
jgi:hypothetical protein